MSVHTTNRAGVSIRTAQIGDMEAVCTIYNHYVVTSTATFDTAQQATIQRVDWFADHQREGLPVIVAEQGGHIIGWGSLSYYHERCAYKSTVEPSVYVHRDYTGRGIGRMLLEQLMQLAETKDYHVLVGKICSENEVSIKLCESLGFERVGELTEVGRKFDRWLNVLIVQRLVRG